MFDKKLFDRNAFDRSVSSSGMSATILATGTLKCNIEMKTPMSLSSLGGSGSVSLNLVTQQKVQASISSNGDVNNVPTILRRPISANLQGSGAIIPKFSVKTPFKGNISGSSGLSVDSRVVMIQNMVANMSARTNLEIEFIAKTPIDITPLSGNSALNGQAILKLVMGANLSGDSELILYRLNALNENAFELININLEPGETVTIDTDLLQVLFGSREDVSAVTTDSVFFELNPGTNEITILTDSNGPLSVTAVWQNRWL